MSSKKKSPWIKLNGAEVADSQIALEHIVKELNLEAKMPKLTPEQKSLVHKKNDIYISHEKHDF